MKFQNKEQDFDIVLLLQGFRISLEDMIDEYGAVVD
jgi:hypothetical protein